MIETRFAGIRPVVHLPLDDTDRIVEAELAALVDSMIGAGATGLVALGLATEAWALTAGEADLVCRTVVEAAGGRVPVTAGVDGPTEPALASASRAREAGVDSLMVRPPAGMSVTDLDKHLTLLSDRLDCPVLLQDAPQATGVDVCAADLITIGRPVKEEAPSSGAKVSALVAAGIEVVAGWGGMHYLESVARGVSGCMPGCDLAAAFVEIDRLARAGEETKADDLYRLILPLLSYETESLERLIAGAKLGLVECGIFGRATTRSPEHRLDEHERRTFAWLFRRLQEDGAPGW
jgi:dihydrodipicolinate synthase/N-acetylneuraminate lyase